MTRQSTVSFVNRGLYVRVRKTVCSPGGGGKEPRSRRRSRFKRDASLQFPFSSTPEEPLASLQTVFMKGVKSPKQTTLAQLHDHLQKVLHSAAAKGGQSSSGSSGTKKTTARVHLLQNPTLGVKFASENTLVILEYPWRLAVRNVEEPVARHRYGT